VQQSRAYSLFLSNEATQGFTNQTKVWGLQKAWNDSHPIFSKGFPFTSQEERLLGFLDAMKGFESAPEGTLRRALGYKIWSNYLQIGAGLRLARVPDFYEEGIELGLYDVLSDFKMEVLFVLAKNNELVASIS
jgi:hypothetical protein